MKNLLLLLLVSTHAFAIGFIEVPKEEKAKLEGRIQKDLGIKSTVTVERLGGDGLRTHNFLFGKLSSENFNKLKTNFAFASKPVIELKYIATKEYELIDFLLPKMQAQVGKNFQSSETIPGTEQLGNGEALEADLSMNCWATAYDVLRSTETVLTHQLYMSKNDVAFAELLRDSKYSKTIKESELKSYDYVLYLAKDASGKTGIDHVAVSLGLGLVFEKTGPTSIDFSQISQLAAVNAQRTRMNEGTKITIEYRRLTAPFPSPIKLWSAKTKNQLTSAELSMFPLAIVDQIVLETVGEMGRTFNRIRDLKLVQAKTGRYVVDPKDPLAKELKGSSIIGTLKPNAKGFAEAEVKTARCKVQKTLMVNVKSAVGDSFQLEVSSFQMIDEDAKCVDATGKAVKSFWIKTGQLVPMH